MASANDATSTSNEVIHISKDAAMRILSDVREMIRFPLHDEGIYYLHDDEDILTGHCTNTLPDYKALLESGHKKAKLRAHSDFYWNKEVNNWAISFLDQFDIMCESKGKNLASMELYKQWKGIV